MTTEEIIKKLQSGVVNFSFIKKDGTVRKATGTRNADVINENNAAPKNESKAVSDVIAYFDTEKKGWRCFRTENFIEFV